MDYISHRFHFHFLPTYDDFLKEIIPAVLRMVSQTSKSIKWSSDDDFLWHTLALTHWGRVMHICVSKLTIIGSDNGLLPGRRQAIIWTYAAILLIGPLGTNFNETSIEIHTFSSKKIHLKLWSWKWRPFCLGLNVLRNNGYKHWNITQMVEPGGLVACAATVIWRHRSLLSHKQWVYHWKMRSHWLKCLQPRHTHITKHAIYVR